MDRGTNTTDTPSRVRSAFEGTVQIQRSGPRQIEFNEAANLLFSASDCVFERFGQEQRGFHALTSESSQQVEWIVSISIGDVPVFADNALCLFPQVLSDDDAADALLSCLRRSLYGEHESKVGVDDGEITAAIKAAKSFAKQQRKRAKGALQSFIKFQAACRGSVTQNTKKTSQSAPRIDWIASALRLSVSLVTFGVSDIYFDGLLY